MNEQPRHPNLHTRPKNSGSAALHDRLESSWGSFGRFFRLMKSKSLSVDKGSGPRTLPERSRGDHLFPSMLVIPYASTQPSSSRRRARGRGREMAWGHVELLWTWFSFLEGGSPFKKSDQEALVARAQQVTWTKMHAEYAGCMHSEISKYIRLQSKQLQLSRGILKLSELVKVVKNSSYTSSSSIEKFCNVAKDVKPDRMSLPEVAGIINPTNYLKGTHKQAFLNMIHDVPLEEEPPDRVQGCFKVNEDDLQSVHFKLLSSGVAVLIPEEMGVRDSNGSLITGGLFAVDHKEHSDRIILDRRPFNQLERRLIWAKLPHGSLLTQLIVPHDHSIRGSGDDLQNYFYLLKHQDNWLPRNSVGKSFDGAGYEQFGGEKGKRYLLAFAVVAMGDLNAVDISQQVHYEILRDCDCLRDNERLEFKSPLPASHTYEGLYIDDHIVAQVLPKRRRRSSKQPFRDEVIIQDSRKQYAAQGIPTSHKKAFTKQYQFTAWGTEVDSNSGRVGTPLKKLCQLSDLVIAVVDLKKVSKKILQSVTGLLVHPFMHRRALMCLLQETFNWIEKLTDNESRPLPLSVREELLSCALCLPLAHTNVRWEISDRIGASDASLGAGGRAATLTCSHVSQALFRFSEHKGEHVRLDWAAGALAPATLMEPLAPELESILADHPWVTTEICTFAHKQHINVLEARMIYRELIDLVHSTCEGLRCVLLVDSRAAAGAWGKGRSSAKNLNRILRRALGWSLAGKQSIHIVWVRSGANPSDYPSRHKPIPPPCPNPSSLSQEVLGDQLDYIRQPKSSKQIWQQVKKGKNFQGTRTDPISTRKGEELASKSDQLLSSGRQKTSEDRDRKPHPTKSSENSPEKAPTENLLGSTHPAAKRWKFREIFSGKGHLTSVFKRDPLITPLEPFEMMFRGRANKLQDILEDEPFNQLCLDACQPKQIWHFGFPCGSFSLLQNLNKGTRSSSHPEGDGSLERERVGNKILDRTVHLCNLLTKHGSFYTLENPQTSFAWKMPSVKGLIQRDSCLQVIVDQCQYNLKVPGKNGELELAKKPTLFVGTVPGLQHLGRRCTGGHQHVQIMGSVNVRGKWLRRSSLAGAYPLPLCKAYRRMCERLFH